MKKGKFTVIYSFRVIDGKENNFIDAWAELTKLFYHFAGSYGSRLHKADLNFYIAYAQWPDIETWKQSSDKLPEISNDYRKQMHESCSEIKTEYEMSVVQDLLYNKQHNENEE